MRHSEAISIRMTTTATFRSKKYNPECSGFFYAFLHSKTVIFGIIICKNAFQKVNIHSHLFRFIIR